MRVFILIFFAAFLMTTSSEAQTRFLKGGLYPGAVFLDHIPGVTSDKPFPIILDLGFEARFARKWSGQASFTYYDRSYDDIFRKRLISFQVRRYNKDTFTNSFFGGFMLQHYLETQSYFSADSKSKRWGLGVIGGYQFKIFRRLGLDIHGGLLAQTGSTESKYRSPQETKTEKIAFKLRPFWSLNLYVALGQMPKKKSKSAENEADTEGGTVPKN